jgi:hypothetical protein
MFKAIKPGLISGNGIFSDEVSGAVVNSNILFNILSSASDGPTLKK